MKLPTLYKKTSTGADQQWTISVKEVYEGSGGNAEIITEWGQIDGKIQVTKDLITKGKNVGRSNETTPVQQAEAEAQSQWEKKLKKGYVKSLKDAQKGKVDDIIEGGYFPMLAHSYDDRGDKITFPAYLQPKLDGHRCTATVGDGDATLWSRTRKPIGSVPHIADALLEVWPGKTIVYPDGELYNHDYHNKFEELTHLIRSSTPEPGFEVLQYHIYDVRMPGTFEKRYEWLRKHLEDLPPSPLSLVKTIKVENEEEMMLAFEEFNKLGYEGAIVRNAEGLYVEKRSVDLQKLKTFMDAEFKVVGVEEGRGKLAGHAMFVCEMPDTKTLFKAKMKGALADLKQYFEKPALAIGREVTVKFQGYTTKNKVPRFPVVWRFAEKL